MKKRDHKHHFLTDLTQILEISESSLMYQILSYIISLSFKEDYHVLRHIFVSL